MDPLLLPTIDGAARMAATRFSSWKPTLFQDYCQGTVARIWREHGPGTTTAYVHCLCEAIGTGYVTASVQETPANLLEHCLRTWLPVRLAAVPREQHLALFARSWNLLEGLLREPGWVNAYVMARTKELDRETELEPFLVRVLKPLFEPAAAASWTGPFRVTLLPLRQADDDFLPGDMNLVAPTVLVVKDRRRPVQCGVILRKQGQSELAGMFETTSPYAQGPSAVVPQWQGESLVFDKERVTLPFLLEPYRWLQVQAGFVAACAVNSQKLWIVETAT